MKREDPAPTSPNVPSRAALDLIDTLDHRGLHHFNSLSPQYPEISAKKLVEDFKNSWPEVPMASDEDWRRILKLDSEEDSELREHPEAKIRDLHHSKSERDQTQKDKETEIEKPSSQEEMSPTRQGGRKAPEKR